MCGGDYDVFIFSKTEKKNHLMKKLNLITVWMEIEVIVVYGAFSENGLFSTDKDVL